MIKEDKAQEIEKIVNDIDSDLNDYLLLGDTGKLGSISRNLSKLKKLSRKNKVKVLTRSKV